MKDMFGKIFKNLKYRGAALSLTAIAAATAMAVGPSQFSIPNSQFSIFNSQFSIPIDTLRHYLPGEIRDSAEYVAAKQAQQRLKESTRYDIRLLTRSYGDSIVLRWLAPDYVGWRYLNNTGVTILRLTDDGQQADTVAAVLKPTPLEKALSLFSESDSLARMGIGMVYNKKGANPYNQKDPAGEMGSIYGVYEDQQMQFAMVGLVAEWRADVATHMGLRFVDRNVKRGRKYQYVVMPAKVDTTGNVILVPAMAEVENNPYTPEVYDAALNDSVSAPANVILAWPKSKHSGYEIERRQTVSAKGDPMAGAWERVNKKTYVVMLAEEESDSCLFADKAPGVGTYEYRIIAHDAFGDLTNPTKAHTVVVPDLVPPTPPIITGFYLKRSSQGNDQPEIKADIRWKKDVIEDDLVGYMPFYRHPRITKGEWWPMSKDMVQPRDTSCLVDVSSLATGDVTIGAYDKTGNIGYSLSQVIRIDDIYPPHVPTGLKAKSSAADGTITLTWNRVTDLDLKYYEVVFANDSTHAFMARKGGQVTDTCFVDTVFMEANQKYIYYKVRAIDETGNQSQLSPMLRVVRPSNVPPVVAHIDSAHTSEKGVYMRWVCSNEKMVARHHLLRRLQSESEWTLLRVCDADSVKAAGDYIELTDVPPVNAQKEWCYAVESFNYSDVSSGLSLQYMTLYRGQLHFDCQLKLYGSYDEKKGETHLAWEMGKQPPFANDWYFCIYRKGAGDAEPKFFMSAEKNERDHTDYVLKPGEEAQYYIYVTYPDGRRSSPSGTVTIKAPAAPSNGN